MNHKPKYILIIEDDVAHADLIDRAFSDHQDQFELKFAHSIQKATTILKDRLPDMVITDMSLPDGNGIEFIKEYSHKYDTPMIVMTSYGNEQIAVEAVQSGALDYIVKSEEIFKAMPRIITRVGKLWQHVIEKKKIKKELQRTQFSVDNALDAIIWVNEQGDIIDINDAACKMFGYPRNELIEMQIFNFSLNHNEDNWADYWNELKVRKSFITESAIRKKDDIVLPIEVASIYIEFDNQELNCIFARDITERKLSMHALKISKEQAENAKADVEHINAKLESEVQRANILAQEAIVANQAKNQFLANISHEIRTPMNAIIGFTELLKYEDITDKQKNYIDTINQACENLALIIEDILDISKIESDKVEIEIMDCSLSEILKTISILMKPEAKKKNLNFDIVVNGNVPNFIRTDPARLRQCFLNLLSNAIKFTNEGSVLLTLDYTNSDGLSTFSFTVTDTGIGIPEDKLSIIFDMFSQVDSGTAKRYDGVGLGLTLTKRLIELLDGSILVNSIPGVGSTFTLQLFGCESFTSEEPIEDQYVSIVEMDMLSENNSKPTIGHVLVAEDNTSNQFLIKTILAKMGFQVTVVDNGTLAVEHAMNQSFDVILMDMNMPKMNGYEAAQQLRENGCKTPIIAVTANAMKYDEEKCIISGCDAYLAKPINQKRLYEALSKFLEIEKKQSVKG